MTEQKKALKKNKYTNMFQLITDKGNICKAYKKSLEGDSKYTKSAILFALQEVYNLKVIQDSLINETYKFDGYYNFKVYEPKERNIDAPIRHKDKVVQLAITQILNEIYDPCFINDNYACIEGKGTHACVDRIQLLMRRASLEYGENTVIIKCDVKNFFASIDREVLKSILHKKIKCKKTMRLLYTIIDSADDLGELGLPLGNPTSQNFANIYMNELDQYCKRKLDIKYYVRYMDDFFIFVNSKDEAKSILELVNSFVENKLKLTLNKNKTKYFPVSQGLNAIGFKIYITHKLLRDDSKRRIKRKIRAMPQLVINKNISIQKAEQMLNSWKGHAENGNSNNFIDKLLQDFDFLYISTKSNGKSVMKIDMDKLYKYYSKQSESCKPVNLETQSTIVI